MDHERQYSAQFLIAVAIAAFLQAWGRPVEGETVYGRMGRRVFGAACGMFMGIYGAPFIMAWRSLEDFWLLPVGIFLAFTGQAIVEFLIELNWRRVMEIYRAWRGLNGGSGGRRKK